MRLLPPVISQDTLSPGEQDIFSRLKRTPGAEDWTVLHSLDIAQHIRQARGEADFVFVVPGLGVLVLEVKAHREIRCEDGRWYLGRDNPPTTRSPFKQASEAMHSLRERVLAVDPSLKDVVFWSAAAFPRVEFKASSAEWHPWQVIDARSMASRPFHELAAAVLVNARRFLTEVKGYSWVSNAPSPDDCKRIVEILRPSFEFYEAPKARKRALDDDLKRYTAEQFMALDAMGGNDRVVFSGPAGTGKTLLALEAARRSAQEGRKVLLLCFNRLLGSALQEQAEGWSSIHAMTLHRYMLRVSGLRIPPGAQESFWREQLPDAALSALLSRDEARAEYDEIIIDEGQDVLHSPYMDVLDLSLEGGLAGGRWLLFGDFSKQDLYRPGALTLQDFVLERGSSAPTYRLTVNCRNTPRIAGYAFTYGGLRPNYTRVLRSDDQVEPALKFCQVSPDHHMKLISALQDLLADGFSNEEIVVLSPYGDARSAAGSLQDPRWSSRLCSLSTPKRGLIRYGTVQAFKGMEAPAVIVTDLPDDTSNTQDLLYVATTRALHRLTVLVPAQHQARLLEFATLSS